MKYNWTNYTILLIFLSLSFAFSQQTPYHGTPFTIPGKIEVEDFDNGGEGVAYHDTTGGNSGGVYRTGEDVDVENCSEGGYNVGWTVTGEWMEYTVDVSEAGTYTLEVRVAYDISAGTFHIEFDGVDKTGPMNIPNTGGLQNYQTLTETGVSLSAGQQIMRFVMDNINGNINYFNFISEGPNTPPEAPTTLLCEGQANPVNVEDFTPDLSWTFNDPDPGNSQVSYQILVADSLSNINADNGNILDTGKLNSSNTSMVYNGTTLATSTKYYWKVKTWDNADAESPYSSVAEFTMSDTVPVLDNYTNPYGVNDWSWPSNICQDFVDAHLKCFRIMVNWSSYEGSRDNYNLGRINEALDNANNVGATLSLCIYYSPSWARSDWNKLLAYSPQEYAEFVTEILNYCENRHPGVVVAVEVENEEATTGWVESIPITNGTDQRDPSWYYADTLKATYQAVQTFNSTRGTDILTVMSGIWYAAYHHLDDLYQTGCKGYFDRINFHYYLIEQNELDIGRPEEPWDTGTIWHFITNLKYLRYIADEWGDDSPIWLSEYGWRISDETKQANYSEYILDTCRKSGYVDLVTIYLGSDPSDRMAVIDENPYSFRELYSMYQNYGNQYPVWNPNDSEVLTPLTPASKDVEMVNPGFEQGDIIGWCGPVIDSEVKHSGNYSARQVAPAGIASDFYSVEQGRLYEITAWIKVEAQDSDSCLIWVGIYDQSDGDPATRGECWEPPNYFGIVDTRNYPNGWRRLRYMYLTSANKNEIALQFGSFGTGTYWLDDVSINALDFLVGSLIVVHPDELNFQEIDIGKTKTLTFEITDKYGKTLSGTISTDKKWIEISPTSFAIDPVGGGNSAIVSVTVDNKILNQSSGTFTGTVIIQSNGGYAEVTVRLTATCVLTKPNPYDSTKGNLVFFGDGIVPNRTTIKIYTLSGELIKTLKNVGQGFNLANANLPTLPGQVPVCPTEIIWDGKNEEGQIVANGIYIYTYESPKEKGVGKFTVIKK